MCCLFYPPTWPRDWAVGGFGAKARGGSRRRRKHLVFWVASRREERADRLSGLFRQVQQQGRTSVEPFGSRRVVPAEDYDIFIVTVTLAMGEGASCPLLRSCRL